jgi:hypothetical protein
MSLEVPDDVNYQESDIYAAIREETELDILEYGDLYEKWYEHEDDLRKISKKFPESIIKLYGYGDNTDDIWAKYFQNGKMQSDSTQIVYPQCKFTIRKTKER